MKTGQSRVGSRHLTLIAALVGTLAGGLAHADRSEEIRFADELDSCVAAVTEHLDLSDANRVRHTVVEKQHSGLGYALQIETSVFANGSERRYAAYCVANGDGVPLKFRIDERVG